MGNQETHTADGLPIPGTVHLVDLNHNMNVKHGGQADVVLVPQPSKNPDDPLNWTNLRKHMTFFWAIWYVFFVSGQGAALSPALLTMEKEMNVPLANLNAGSGYLFLFYGLGCLFWQPMALAFGRRPVLIFTLIAGGIGCQIWLAHTTGTGNYYANRIFTGFFLSPVESLVEIVVTDLYFAHERGFFLGIYIFALVGASFLCPIASGFVLQSQGWQWIPYWFAIFCGVGIIGSYFMLEETMFHRDSTESDVNEESNLASSTVLVEGESEATAGQSDVEKVQGVSNSSSSADEHSYSEGVVITYTPKTYRQRIALWESSQIRANLFWPSVYRPILILYKFPLVGLGGLIVASSLAWFNILSATLASVLLVPPYSFSGNALSLFYFGPVVAVVIGCIVTGPVSDWFCLKLARRNGGVREPEYRLWIGLTCVLLNPLGMWLYGIGAYYNIHWVGILFGVSIVVFAINLGAAVPYIYVLDSYKEMSGNAMVTVILIRNLFGFAFAYAITPWINAQGLKNTYLVVGFLSLAFWAIVIPMIIWGKTIRTKSAAKYHAYIQTNSSH